MACDPSERQKRSNVAELVTTTEIPARKGNECIPGTRWKSDCNNCWCSENGFAACTLKGCLGHGQKFHKIQPAYGVEIGDSNNVPAPIRRVRDTKHASIPTIEVSTVETLVKSTTPKPNPANLSPNAQKKRKQRAAETKSKQQRTFDTQQTESPSEWDLRSPSPIPTTAQVSQTSRVDYNTKVYTEAQVLDPKFTCTPSEAFKVECNTCWCNASGKGVRYCTRLGCHPKVYPTLAPPK